MISYEILPRELSIAYNLRKFMELNHFDLLSVNAIDKSKLPLENKILLEIILPNKEERRSEIYNLTVELASILVNSSEDANFIKYVSCSKDCIFTDPIYIYYKSGIEVSLDDVQDDLVTDLLKQKFPETYLIYYGMLLTLSIQKLIEHNLHDVNEFIDKEISIFKEPKKVISLFEKIINSNKEQNFAELEKYIDIEKFWSSAKTSRIVKVLSG